VKVTSPEKALVPVVNFEWSVKLYSSEISFASSLSSPVEALLDPGVLEPVCSARILRRKFSVGQRVLDYLQSHSALLATLCGLLSCRKKRPTALAQDPSEEGPTEGCAVYYRTKWKSVRRNGCLFVREVQVPCSSADGGRAGGSLGGADTAAGVDENLRDYVFRKLKHQLPTLKRFLVQFLSPLMPGADDPTADPFWLLCSREIPDELCTLLPTLFTDKYFTCHVYRRISQLLQVHSLQSVGFDQLAAEPNSRSVAEILRLFEVVPSSVVQNSILWTALRDFIVAAAVQDGSLPPAYCLRLSDPATRCRLLLSIATHFDPSERSVFCEMLKSCLTDSDCPHLKHVVEKRVITEKLYSEVTELPRCSLNLHKRSLVIKCFF